MANLANANTASANTVNAVNTSTSVTPGAIPLPRQTADVAVARRPRKNNTFRIVTYVVLSLAAIIYLAPEARPQPMQFVRDDARKRKIDPVIEHKEKLRQQFWEIGIDEKHARRRVPAEMRREIDCDGCLAFSRV